MSSAAAIPSGEIVMIPPPLSYSSKRRLWASNEDVASKEPLDLNGSNAAERGQGVQLVDSAEGSREGIDDN